MTDTPSPRRRDDPRMRTVEMAAVLDELADEDLPAPDPLPELTARRTALLVAGGGALGALVRWSFELIAPSTITPTVVEIPWATWSANVLGCLVMGVLTGVLETSSRAPRWVRPLVGTGFCGGFTTMSTLVLQVSAMIGADFPFVALEYGLGSAIFAIAALVVGLVAGRMLGRRS